MIIRRVFGKDNLYIARLSKIRFNTGSVRIVSSFGAGGESAAERKARENAWLAGQKKSIGLIDIMLEDVQLGEPEKVRGDEDPTVPKSNHIFIVHGHDNEMKLAIARTIERIGLEAVILHERPNRGQTIIEKIERY